MTTIVLAEDHHLVRQGLRVLIEAQRDLAVVDEVADGLKVADVVARVRPNVLIVDLMMPGLHGLEVIRRVRRRSPETRVIVLSMYVDQAYVAEALRSGAVGYVPKSASGAELIKAVRRVMEGHRHLSPPLSAEAIEEYARRTRSGTLDLYDMLTPREREVLQLVAEGFTSPGIAARLDISSRTVESHRANLMRKLGLRSQSALVRYAVRRGLVPLQGDPRTPGGRSAPGPGTGGRR